MVKFRLLQLPLLLLALISHGTAQFTHTDHKQIVDANNKPLFLRATNLGNWLVPEGYMWLFEGGRRKASLVSKWLRDPYKQQRDGDESPSL